MKGFLAHTSSIFMAALCAGQNVLPYSAFMQSVAANHPIVVTSDQQVELSEAALRLQRAVTDPYLAANYADKAYDDKDYYEKSSLKLAIPTSIGAEIFAGYANITGDRVNPELGTSTAGMYEAGVSMPLGSKLIFNERTLAIRTGKIMVDASEEERKAMLNNLYYRANLAYINWALSTQLLQVQQSAEQVAIDQFQLIKTLFEKGDGSAIDTVEAFLQVQNRQSKTLEAQNNTTIARLIASTFMWDTDHAPLEINPATNPEPLDSLKIRFATIEDSLLAWQSGFKNNHPLLKINRLEIEALRLEQQNATSDFLPQLELKYAVLSPGISNRNIAALGFNDRMLGAGIKYPLLLRKERSKLNLIGIKSAQKSYELELKTTDIEAKIGSAISEYETQKELAALYERMVENYERMLRAEQTKLELGESSVFLLNSRENNLFDSESKALETKAKALISGVKIIESTNRNEAYLRIAQ